jgi:hypothetical protein
MKVVRCLSFSGCRLKIWSSSLADKNFRVEIPLKGNKFRVGNVIITDCTRHYPRIEVHFFKRNGIRCDLLSRR